MRSLKNKDTVICKLQEERYIERVVSKAISGKGNRVEKNKCKLWGRGKGVNIGREYIKILGKER